jgi:hypothetical protein
LGLGVEYKFVPMMIWILFLTKILTFGMPAEQKAQQITLTVNGKQFAATLENNATSNAFKEMLPLTLNMKEFNANEKFAELPKSLPTNQYNPGTIQVGDILLYGSSTIVVFYKKFDTPYRYTKIGKIDQVDGLEASLGEGNVKVSFGK